MHMQRQSLGPKWTMTRISNITKTCLMLLLQHRVVPLPTILRPPQSIQRFYINCRLIYSMAHMAFLRYRHRSSHNTKGPLSPTIILDPTTMTIIACVHPLQRRRRFPLLECKLPIWLTLKPWVSQCLTPTDSQSPLTPWVPALSNLRTSGSTTAVLHFHRVRDSNSQLQ